MRIENTSLALAALQAEMVKRLQQVRRTQASGGARSIARRAPEGAAGERSTLQRLQVQLGSIPPADPDAPRKVFRLFLESVFVEQFGDAVVLDPAFFAMVDEVQRQMEANVELQRRIEALARSILHPATTP